MKTACQTMPFCECRQGIYVIDEFGCTEIYVIVGEEKALVIDTGTGIGDLKGLIENKITDKPYEVIASHNHVDHLGGAGWFEKIHMHPADIAQADPFFPPTWEFRKTFAQIMNGPVQEGCAYTEEDIRQWPATPEFIPLEDGQVFDLGGRTVTAWHCPGHTAGEMVFLDDLTRTLLCGDAFNCNWLFDCSKIGDAKENVEVALDAMKRIYDMRDQYDSVYNFHHDFRDFGEPFSIDVMGELIECLEQMKDGKAEFLEMDDGLNPGHKKTVAVNKHVFVTFMGGDIRELCKTE